MVQFAPAKCGFWLALAACWLMQPAHARVPVGGSIGTDTAWTNSDTVQVTSSVIVLAPGHLTIEPGTVVLFDGTTGLIVAGELTAEGESGRVIIFSASADTAGGTPAGTWGGITLNANSIGVLRNCEIRYAVSGVSVLESTAAIDSTAILNFTNAGVYADGGSSSPRMSPTIRHCTIQQQQTNLRGTGVGIYARLETDVTVTGCVIHQCRYGLEFYSLSTGVPRFQVSGCNINNHLTYGIYLHGG